MYDNAGTCTDCSFPCLSCTSEFTCDHCVDEETRDGENNCQCIYGTYENNDNVCPGCDSTCASCINYDDYCIECAGDLVGAPKCVEPIPVAQSAKLGVVPVGSAKVVVCDYKCLTCEDYATNCLECDENRNIDNDCKCSDGYYEKDGVCIACNYKCAKCTWDDVCSECTDVNRVPELCDCVAGYYDIGEAKCETCAPQCDECTGTDIYCTKCDITRIQGDEPDCRCPDG